ncbi:MAG: sugar phosphate nucleotidyltransferase, partial [Gammaproteobacteria bacterium]
VLTAAVADLAETEFGWIQPGRAVAGPGWAAFSVSAFHEKPDASTAARYLQAGYLWNTMIVACTVENLWRLAAERLPDMSTRFAALRDAWPTATREVILHDAYATMPNLDFSRDLLEKSTAECLLLPLKGIAWSDWGRPARIAASVAEFALRPNYAEPPVGAQLTRLAS